MDTYLIKTYYISPFNFLRRVYIESGNALMVFNLPRIVLFPISTNQRVCIFLSCLLEKNNFSVVNISQETKAHLVIFDTFCGLPFSHMHETGIAWYAICSQLVDFALLCNSFVTRSCDIARLCLYLFLTVKLLHVYCNWPVDNQTTWSVDDTLGKI